MRRATVTIPDDLEKELDAFLRAQDAAPSLASVLQVALRRFLEERRWAAREFQTPRGPLRVTPATQGSGSEDGSVEHDRYLAGPS